LITLRPYQQEAVTAIRKEWAAGRSTLAALATGAGKTEIFLAALDAEREHGLFSRAIIIAHREELIAQPLQRIHQHWPELSALGPGVVKAEKDHYMSRLIIATVQTLVSTGRLTRILDAGAISHVIIDEAHHAPASTYQGVLLRLIAHNPNIKILGVTATPKREDGLALGSTFDSVAYRFPITKAIKAGALVPLLPLGVQVPVSIKNVGATAGDWAAKPLANVLDAANVRDIIVQTWQRECSQPLMPTITFAATRQAAKNLQASFEAAGIPAGFADSTTKPDERRQVLDDFRAGKLHVLCNCAIWTEGVDLPMASCIMVCRPTKSDSLYLQMVGRGLRLWPNKDKALIIDFVPLDSRDMKMAGDLLEGEFREQVEKAVAVARKAGVVMAEFDLLDGPEGDISQLMLKLLPYLGRQKLSWTLDGKLASAGAGRDCSLGIMLPNGDGAFHAYVVGDWRKYQHLGSAATYEDIVAIAEDYAEENGDSRVNAKGRRWRDNGASMAQEKLLRRWGSWTDGMKRGAASQAITHKMVQEALARL